MTAQHIEAMWRLFRVAEAIPPDEEERERYMFFCGAWAAFHALARVRFSGPRVGEVHGEMRAFRDSVFEG